MQTSCCDVSSLWRLICPRRLRSSRPPLAHQGSQHVIAPERAPADDPLALAFYQEERSLFTQLSGETPPVRLLRSSWLIARARRLQTVSTEAERRSLALPRRQLLERDEPWAFYSAEEVEALPRGPEAAGSPLHIVSVSHCWGTPQHPDPLGRTLEMLADEILTAQTVRVSRAHVREDDSRRISDGQTHLHMLPSEVAVFYDYCSLCQKDEAGNRTPEEEACFHRALATMQVWYAHLGTTVFLMTEVPAEYDTSAYHERGWPTFERLVSMIAKRATISAWPMIVDVGSGTGTSQRLPPLTPEAFRSLLEAAVFTNGADRDMVIDLYRQTCEAVLRGASSLRYSSLDWSDNELKTLCVWLSECHELAELALTCNPRIGDDGLCAFAAAVRKPGVLPNLQTFALEGSLHGVSPQFGDAGVRALTAALASRALPKLAYIDVTGSCASLESMRELTTVCRERAIFCCSYERDDENASAQC